MAILLITATITPPANAANLARSDPAKRLADYRTALSFYVGQLEAHVIDAIVFVDNSESDIRVLRELASLSTRADRIELIGFAGIEYPSEFGRGYGEMRLVDHAMACSRLIGEAPPEMMVWKVTGRYVVRNMQRLMTRPTAADVCCQCRDVPMRWADMYFMGWTKASYKTTLLGVAERIKEGSGRPSAEVRFRQLIDELAQRRPVQRRFAEPPVVVGVRGWDNQPYEQQRGKRLLRQVLARVAPWLWI
jgi:hypothetical protein